jgi:hypothetical protein
VAEFLGAANILQRPGATYALRPEQLRLVDGEGLAARVTGIVFRGEGWMVECLADDGQPLRVSLPAGAIPPVLDAAVMLGFAEIAEGDVHLTAIGRDFATTTIQRSKDLFRQQALGRIPVLSSIVSTLKEKKNLAMRSEFFLGIWDDYFPIEEAESQLATAVDWGRYAELFEYDSNEGRLYLPGN